MSQIDKPSPRRMDHYQQPKRRVDSIEGIDLFLVGHFHSIGQEEKGKEVAPAGHAMTLTKNLDRFLGNSLSANTQRRLRWEKNNPKAEQGPVLKTIGTSEIGIKCARLRSKWKHNGHLRLLGQEPAVGATSCCQEHREVLFQENGTLADFWAPFKGPVFLWSWSEKTQESGDGWQSVDFRTPEILNKNNMPATTNKIQRYLSNIFFLHHSLLQRNFKCVYTLVSQLI